MQGLLAHRTCTRLGYDRTSFTTHAWVSASARAGTARRATPSASDRSRLVIVILDAPSLVRQPEAQRLAAVVLLAAEPRRADEGVEVDVEHASHGSGCHRREAKGHVPVGCRDSVELDETQVAEPDGLDVRAGGAPDVHPVAVGP